MLWLLAGCLLPEADDPTLLRALTVLDAVPTPNQVGPGEVLRLDVTVVDPNGGDLDALVWACSLADERCAEAGPPALPLSAFTAVRRDVGSQFSVSWLVPEATRALLPEEGAATALVWVLVCRPGVCGILNEVEAAPAPGTPAWERVVDLLSDPVGLVERHDLDEAALGLRRIVLTTFDPVDRRPGPTVTRIGGPLEVAPGGSVAVELLATGALEAWPYATVGSWQYVVYDLSAGATSMRWTAPMTAGVWPLYVVARDGYGGSAVWEGTVDVR